MKIDSNENRIESEPLRGQSLMNFNGARDSTVFQFYESEVGLMVPDM